jgi:hypothetical protein
MTSMRKFLPILLAACLAASSARAALVIQTVNPTIGTTNTTFNFNLFDSNLGTLTAVDLIFNSSIAGGSFSIDTRTSGEEATFQSITAFMRTSGTGLTNQNTASVGLTMSPSLPYVQDADTLQSYSVLGSQSLLASPLTYSINPANWSSYLVAGGVGNTPNFIGRAFTSATITSAAQPSTSNTFTATSSYTLRYTYTPADPSPVPEPGQVAASLLLIGGIGTYFLIKRRRTARQAVG